MGREGRQTRVFCCKVRDETEVLYLGEQTESFWVISCFYLPSYQGSTKTVDVHYLIQLYLNDRGLNSGPHTCMPHTLPTKASP